MKRAQLTDLPPDVTITRTPVHGLAPLAAVCGERDALLGRVLALFSAKDSLMRTSTRFWGDSCERQTRSWYGGLTHMKLFDDEGQLLRFVRQIAASRGQLLDTTRHRWSYRAPLTDELLLIAGGWADGNSRHYPRVRAEIVRTNFS